MSPLEIIVKIIFDDISRRKNGYTQIIGDPNYVAPIALKAANGKYISLVNGDRCEANSDKIGPENKFKLIGIITGEIPNPFVLAIQIPTHEIAICTPNGKYLVATDGGILLATKDGPLDGAIFTLQQANSTVSSSSSSPVAIDLSGPTGSLSIPIPMPTSNTPTIADPSSVRFQARDQRILTAGPTLTLGDSTTQSNCDFFIIPAT